MNAVESNELDSMHTEESLNKALIQHNCTLSPICFILFQGLMTLTANVGNKSIYIYASQNVVHLPLNPTPRIALSVGSIVRPLVTKFQQNFSARYLGNEKSY